MRILVTEPLDPAGIALLEEQFTVDLHLGQPRSALLTLIRPYDAVITRSGTPVTADLLAAGRDLRVVGRAGIGVDNIDIPAATRRGVAVVNAPNGNVRAAAEHTLALLFALARNVPQAQQKLRDGVWGKSLFMGTEIAGKTLGIIGLGKVGSQVARKAAALDMDVIAYDPFIAPREDVPLVALDELLRRADIVTLHVPLTPITANMITARELGLMKANAFLINCARGKVVDEAALYDACKGGRIAGAAVDAFAAEPPGAHPLFELPNVVVTPHLGGTTHESMRASALEIAEEVAAVLRGERPRHCLNEEVLDRQRTPHPIPTERANTWAGYDTILLDCDSTLTTIEGIDELAALNGCREAVAALTTEAMDGMTSFDTVFARRLDHIQPTRTQLETVGHLYADRLAEDAGALVAALRALGRDVRVLSGGYADAMAPLAAALDLPRENFHAVELAFDAQGQYLGYDATQPLCRTGGKGEAVTALECEAPTTMLVGDGASDLEARDTVGLFVGHGGVVQREHVRRAAGIYLHCASLAPLLVLAAGQDGCLQLLQTRAHRDLVIKGLGLLLQPAAVQFAEEYAPLVRKLRRFCLEGICN
jgi:HAD superfamily phosphoserine phosphatase-like hydrolase